MYLLITVALVFKYTYLIKIIILFMSKKTVNALSNSLQKSVWVKIRILKKIYNGEKFDIKTLPYQRIRGNYAPSNGGYDQNYHIN